jgi:hypothetical protein
MKIKRVIFAILIASSISIGILRSQTIDTKEIEAVRNKSVLDSKDKQIIDTFLEQAIEDLIRTRDFTSIARIRTVILSNQSTQGQYAKQFSESAYKYISLGLQQAANLPQERRFKITLNLLILIDGLKDPRLSDLAIAELKDNNEVIRYWAVRCITNPDLISKLNSADASHEQLKQSIIVALQQLLDSNPPPADEILALITEFAAESPSPEREDLLKKIADIRIKQYADWSVKYELLDINVLKALANKINSTEPNRPEIARRFAQLYSYVVQRLIKGQELSEDNKQYLASVLLEIDDKCISKILGTASSNIKRAVEQDNISLLEREYDRLFGNQTKAGELTSKLNIDYGTDANGRKRIAPQPLPDPPETKIPHNKNSFLPREMPDAKYGQIPSREYLPTPTRKYRPSAAPARQVGLPKPFSGSSISSLEAYQREINGSGILIESEHISYFAPKLGEPYARLVVPILERAYKELKVWHAGAEPSFRISVEHYPNGHPRNKGGTSDCVIFYGFENIGRMDDNARKIPHVSGYIEEMAHNFDGACGVMGWLYEAFGNYTANAITLKVAPYPEIEKYLQSGRYGLQRDAETFDYYMTHGFKLPPDVPQNLFDRIYRHVFRMLEPSAGHMLLPRFYQEIKKSGVPKTRSEAERAYVVAEVFSKITGTNVKELFRQCGIAMHEPINDRGTGALNS